jgi:hypothetical protein
MKMLWNDIELLFYGWYLRYIKKPRCLVCKEVATLQLDYEPVLWICENCAQIQSELASEEESND